MCSWVKGCVRAMELKGYISMQYGEYPILDIKNEGALVWNGFMFLVNVYLDMHYEEAEKMLCEMFGLKQAPPPVGRKPIHYPNFHRYDFGTAKYSKGELYSEKKF